MNKVSIGPKMTGFALKDLDVFGKEEVGFKNVAEENIKRRLSQIKTQRDSLFSMNASGRITESYLDEKLKELKDEEELLNNKLTNSAEETAQSIEELKKIVGIADRLPGMFERSKINEKGLLLRLVFRTYF